MSYNFCAVLVGPPGCGKTTLAAQVVKRHIADGGIVFVHDPVQQFAKHGCKVYRDAAAYRKAATDAHAAGEKIPAGASLGGSAADVTKLALEIGEKCNRADNVRVKILEVLDEASLGASGPTWVDAQDNELLATRRHRGIGILMNVQQPNQLTARFYGMSTDVCLFRSTTDRAAQLDGMLLLEKGELARAGAAQLADHTYLHVRVGKGIVREPL